MHIVVIGMTLFALFFGAGNLIFPVMLGQLAGDHFTLASMGFIITGVVLPLLGIVAVGISGEKDCLKITQRGGVIFGLIFTTTLYLTIGPLFAMPRTGSVSYEIGIKPFISDEHNKWCLALFTFVFYGVCCLLSLNSSRFIDVVGKFLTPIKISFILILILAAIIIPMGEPLKAVTSEYKEMPFFTGFSQGYLTMDTLASLVFGIIVVQSIMNDGVKDKTQIIIACLKASLIASAILAFFYFALAYMGATSVAQLGILDNGGQVLAQVSTHYFSEWGNIILGLMITVACMTTNIGLTHACANYLVSIFPKLSYRQYAIIFSIMSALFANIGLTELISVSKPVLSIIYPVTIIIILLIFTDRLFNGRKMVYMGAIYLTLLTSIVSELTPIITATNLTYSQPNLINGIQAVDQFLASYIPLYQQGLGWMIMALFGAILGFIFAKFYAIKQAYSH